MGRFSDLHGTSVGFYVPACISKRLERTIPQGRDADQVEFTVAADGQIFCDLGFGFFREKTHENFSHESY